MAKYREIKPVSFNKKDRDEQLMLRHVEGLNFSQYVKRLIYLDMHGSYSPQTSTQENKLSYDSSDKDFMKDLV
jgi:hypothetical protein